MSQDQANATPVADAVSSFEQLLEKEEQAESPTPPSNEEPEQSENAVVEGEDAVDSPEPVQSQPEETVDIEIDGKPYKVPKELEASFLMQKDYTQKTQAVAERERQLESERQAINNLKSVSAQEIQLAAQLVDVDTKLQAYNNVDWNALYQQDPALFSWHQKQMNDLERSKNSGLQQMQSLGMAREQEATQARATRLAVVRQEVKKIIPNYSDEVDKKLLTYAMSKGFSKEALSNISNAREVETLYKAYQWDQLQSSKASTVKRVEQLPKVIKPGTAQADPESGRAELMKKLKNTGSRDIAAKLFEKYA